MCIWLVCGRDKHFFTAIASKIGEDEGVGVTVVTKTPFDDIFFMNFFENNHYHYKSKPCQIFGKHKVV